jgi:tetratricopeptide (TPR) repeat protein
MDIRRKILGANHPDYAASLNNLGGAFFDLGDYDRAISYYSEGQAIYIDNYGEQHPYSALGYLNIGNCYVQLDRLSQAIEYYEKAMEVYEKVIDNNKK